MASTEFSVADLVKALDGATEQIQQEVSHLITGAANVMVTRVQAAYPVGKTGNLRRRVMVTQPKTFSAGVSFRLQPKVVKAYAPHVHIWQEGTKERFDATRGNARRGKSPAHGRVFEAIAAKTREGMLQACQDLLDRKRELV